MTVTAWRLTDPRGRPARCLVSERDNRWQMLVWHGSAIVLWERFGTDDEALARADDLWRVLVAHGWVPADERAKSSGAGTRRDYYRRACPECRQQTGVVTYRRHGYVVLFCESCEHGWADRERVGIAQPRQQGERRRAA